MFKEVEDKNEANIAIIIAESFSCGNVLDKFYYKVDCIEDISGCIVDMTEHTFIPYDADVYIRRVRFGRIIGRE